MRTPRLLLGAVATSAVLASAACASGAFASDESSRQQPVPVDVYVEPFGHPLVDGAYLGYVRRAVLPDTTVAVDFVSFAVDFASSAVYAVGDERGEELVYAGGLALLDLVGFEARPFRIMVQGNAIVGLQSADDLLSPRP